MIRFLTLMAAIACGLAAGCGRTPQLASDEKFITEEEWRTMPPHEKFDPYTLEHLQKRPAKK